MNSYQEAHEVDFTKLVEGQLFGIFGPVGSGKSTILEAIALALYGESERLLYNDNRNYNLMNLRSDELWVDFVFELDQGGEQYRFTVQGKRNRKRFEKVNTFSRAAYKWTKGEWLPIANDSAESILGLNYKNFRRTVIIPQGKFQEFLRLKAADRTRMLKEIFALERFDLSNKVKSLAHKNLQQMERLEGSLAEYGTVSKEALLVKGQELHKVQEALAALENSLLQEQRFKTAMEQYFSNQNRYTQAEKKKKDVAKAIEDLELSLKSRQTQFEQLEKQYQGLEQLKHQVADLKRVKTINADKEQMFKNGGRLEKGAQIQQEQREEAQQIEAQIDQLEATIKEKKANRPDQSELSAVQLWFNTQKNLVKTRTENERKALKLAADIKQLSDQALHPLKDFLLSDAALLSAAEDLTSVQPYFSRKVAELEEKRRKLGLEEKQLLVDVKLGDWADRLQADEPCPLCGSLHHPELHDAAASKTRLQQLQQGLQKVEGELKTLQQLLQDFDRIKTKLEGKQEQAQELDLQIAGNSKGLEEHLRQFKWPNFDPKQEALLVKAIEAAAAHNRAIEQQEQVLEKARTSLKANLEKQRRYQVELDKIKDQQTRLQAEIDVLIKNMQVLDADAYETEKELNLKRHVEELEKDISDISWNYETASKEINTIRQELSKRSGELGVQQELVLDYAKELEASEGRVDQAIMPGKTKLLWGKAKEQGAQSAEYLQFIAQLERGERQLKEQSEHRARLQSEYNRFKEDLQKKEALEETLTKAKERGENIQILANLFRGDGFVNYISSIYLQELCQAANQRFYKLTRQQLRLEINEKNEFIVRDYLNEGKTRLAKTLSGGQTFQAALSLALALAESIRMQSKASQNFFFMDEGFGSQDEASLQLVMDSLKALRKENRIVGIISHVEALKREIDVFLAIQNDAEQGSRISHSWD